VEREQRVELVGRCTVLSRGEGKNSRTEARLGSMCAARKASVRLPESTSGVRIPPLINREVSKEDERRPGECVLRVPTYQLA
jgi:hypothetical protein